jgi:hypothetical protein
MTPEQRYFFDVAGYLQLKNVLSEEELKPAQEAADRYIRMAPEDWPPGFGADLERPDLTGYRNGFAFDKAMELFVVHSVTWPILMELTNYRPRFTSGTLGHNRHGHWFHPLHAGWNPVKQPDTRRYYTEDGKIRCTDFIFFFYLTDVLPGDGGLIVLPGSHKSNFLLPKDMYYQSTYDNEGYMADFAPLGVKNFPARAGDVIIISERLIHGVLNWKPRDRDRRFLIMRYTVQHAVTSSLTPFSGELRARLSPETLEMIELAPYNHIKNIVQERCGEIDPKNHYEH